MRKLFSDEEEREILNAYLAGQRYRQLTKIYKCGNNTIWKTLKRQNCPIKGHVGQHHPRWRGGFTYRKGYKRLYLPKHPSATKGGLISEHRLIMENYLGRTLENDEIVHHINGIRDDNRIENLEIMSPGEHSTLHNLNR
jgi:hypothetical protein